MNNTNNKINQQNFFSPQASQVPVYGQLPYQGTNLQNNFQNAGTFGQLPYGSNSNFVNRNANFNGQFPSNSNLTIPQANETAFRQQKVKSPEQNVVTFEETLQESIFNVSKHGSSRLLLKRHPHLEELPAMGLEYPKEIKELDDWSLTRSVIRWQPINKMMAPHKESLLYVIGKINNLEIGEYSKRRERSPNGSLMARMINAVNATYEGNRTKAMSTHSIDSLMNEMMSIIRETAMNRPAKAGQYSFRAMATCNNYNSTRGCNAQNCTYLHVCNRCIRANKKEKHPGHKCASSNH